MLLHLLRRFIKAVLDPLMDDTGECKALVFLHILLV